MDGLNLSIYLRTVCYPVLTGCASWSGGRCSEQLISVDDRSTAKAMAITKSTVFAVLFLVLVLSTETANLVKIHRASPRIKSKSPQENNGWFSMCRYLPDFSRLFSKNKEAWLYSIPCTFLVGLCGVFPLLVIPVESGQALKEGGKFWNFVDIAIGACLVLSSSGQSLSSSQLIV